MFTHLYSLDSVQDGFTALLVAAQEGHCGVVRILLEAKADVNMKNSVSESCSSNGVVYWLSPVLSVCGVSDNELVQGVPSLECTRVQSTLTLSSSVWCVHVTHVLLVDFH